MDQEEEKDTTFIPSTMNPLKEKEEEDNQNQAPLVMNDEDEDVEDAQHFYCCQQQEKICGMKVIYIPQPSYFFPLIMCYHR